MADAPRRRATDRVSASPTFVGVGTTFSGNLACEGDLVVGGEVIGDGSVQGAFTLAEGGRWEGRIEAKAAVIAGEWLGEIVIAEKLEIRKTARIRGRVAARSIAVAKGALIDGEMSVTSGAPIVTYEEKRAG